MRKQTAARIYQRHVDNTSEKLAARAAMTDAFRLACELSAWVDDGYCIDAPQDIPAGSHWQGGRHTRTRAGNFRKGTVYPNEASRDGFVNPLTI